MMDETARNTSQMSSCQGSVQSQSCQSSSPDLLLVEFLCEEVIPNININQELLINWQIELVEIDSVTTLSTLVEQDIIIDEITTSRVNVRKIKDLFERLFELEDDLLDFKVIMLEIILYVISGSLNIKIQLMRYNFHHFLIDRFLKELSRTKDKKDIVEKLVNEKKPNELNDKSKLVKFDYSTSNLDNDILSKPSLLNQLMRSIVTILELGCDVKYFRKLILPLFARKSETDLILLELLNRVIVKYPSHFKFTVFNNLTCFPFINEDMRKKFSIQSWFKVCNVQTNNEDPINLFVLTNSNVPDSNQTTLRVQLINYNQILIELRNNQNGSRIQFAFNQILNLQSNPNNQGYIHFVLTYDSYSNLNLYIDGEYSESIPCPDLHKQFSGWNKVYIGNTANSEHPQMFYQSLSDELVVKNLTILNIDLSHEWINLLFNLGLGYEWDFKELSNDNLSNLLNHLSFRGLVNVGIKVRELKNKSNNIDKTQKSMDQKASNTTANENLDDPFHLIDKEFIVKALSKIKQENILFDTNDFFLTLQHQQKSHLDDDFKLSYKFHNSESIHGAIYCIGGTSLFLNLIETSIDIGDGNLRDTIIYKTLSLLLTIINNNWRLNKEFENISGHGVLSVLLTNYKEKYNKSLTLSVIRDFEDKSEDVKGCKANNVLNLILKYSGYDLINPFESIIINPLTYRFLLLNFDLFFETESFEYLLYHYQMLTCGSQFGSFNNMELSKMKLLKKIIQFLKNPALVKAKLSNSLKEQLGLTLTSVLRAETSVETIRSISLCIIYSIYSPDCSTDCGIIMLNALTNILCSLNSSIRTLKKFSRSITIHWILLLFNYRGSKDVVKCGIKLLSKLLSILGPHIIKRFFQVNHGLDILTHFLKDWWDDDEILCCIFLSSFGLDLDDRTGSEDTNLDLVSIWKTRSANMNLLVIPELLILLNNLVLSSTYTLSLKNGKLLSSNPSSPTKASEDKNSTLSFDVLHLINEYCDGIKLGFENNVLLRSFYFSKEFLDGIFEVLGYLKLFLNWPQIGNHRNFREAFDKLIKILSDIFIRNFVEDTFMNVIESLSDFTKKLLLDLIFPKIFEHINEFINVSNFIFNEKEFVNSTIILSNYYIKDFVRKNYFISQKDLNMFVTCVLSIAEIGNNSLDLKKLKKEFGNIIILSLLKLGDDQRPELYKDTVKLFLYRQITILQKDILDDKKIGETILLMLGIFLNLTEEEQNENLELTFSFLRTCYLMNQDDFSNITRLIDLDQELLHEFCQNLISKNDEETLSRLTKYPPFTKGISRGFHTLIGKYQQTGFLNVLDMITVTLHNGGKLGFMNSIYVKSFEKDCKQLKSLIINGELVKFYRSVQDGQENVQFYISNYQVLRTESRRLIIDDESKKNLYILDYIENNDRMRQRLIIEDQLPESEKLSYNITIPIKHLEIETHETSDSQDYNYELSVRGIDTIGLSNEESFLLDPTDSYELIDEHIEPSHEDSSTFNTYEDKNRKVLRSLYMGDQIIALWNISQINGLVPIESLMILGTNHLYLIENYIHCTDGNVVDVQDAPSDLRDPILQLINSQSSKILKNDPKSHRYKNWSLDKLSSISKRHFLLRDIALEMFFSDGASILLTCVSNKDRDIIYNKLSSFASGKGLDHDLLQALQISSSSLLINRMPSSSFSFTSKLASAFSHNSLSSSSTSTFVSATKKWKMGEMSNFYYLMIINTLAGRTFNDLTQYPVFPWVIADYTSESLDFSDPKTFRDLSKPMGAQTSARANQFKERFDALDSLNDHDAPAFHYGTHYSSAMIVTSFLIRLKPYVQSYLLLQGGRFDHADRLFNSIEKAWNSASKDSTTDVRELIPEFYFLPDFLVNSNNFELGKLQNGEQANHVDLPPWAKGDPRIFIAKNREALESSYVSANLHLWIELIFGHKQNGPDAVNSLNVFHHLSYNGAINLDGINDEVEKRAVIGMINNFGQTPMKLFHKPHPHKEVLNLPNYYLSMLNMETPKLVFESKLKLPIEKLEISSKSGKKWVGRPCCITSEDDLLIRKANSLKSSGSLIINQTTFLNIHLSNITSIAQLGHKLFLTGSDDGIINAWKCHTKPATTLQLQSIFRGHFCAIVSLKFSKSFKIGLSSDVDGVVIVWDLIRFKFIRKIHPPKEKIRNTIINISNDTGNIGIMYSTESQELFYIYNINGELITIRKFPSEAKITSFNFGSTNNPMVNTGKILINNDHTFWSKEVIAIAFGKSLKIYELDPFDDNGWSLSHLNLIDLLGFLDGDITALELINHSEVDFDEKLCRGQLKLIIGDRSGKVYVI